MAFFTLSDSSVLRVGEVSIHIQRTGAWNILQTWANGLCVCMRIIFIIKRVYDEQSLSGGEFIFSRFSALIKRHGIRTYAGFGKMFLLLLLFLLKVTNENRSDALMNSFSVQWAPQKCADWGCLSCDTSCRSMPTFPRNMPPSSGWKCLGRGCQGM